MSRFLPMNSSLATHRQVAIVRVLVHIERVAEDKVVEAGALAPRDHRHDHRAYGSLPGAFAV